MKKYYWLLILSFIGLLFLALWGFTRMVIWPTWNFSNTGQIGDTIGGITSPFINLLGAILVYLSFQQQRKANEIQVKSLEEEKERINALNKFNQIYNILEDLKEEFENFSVKIIHGIFRDEEKIILGNDALKLFWGDLKILKEQKYQMEIQNFSEASQSYVNLMYLSSFVAKAIIEYQSDHDHSKNVLVIKFRNIISKQEEQITNILHSSEGWGSEKNIGVINSMSRQVYNQISKVLAKLPSTS